MTAPQNDQPQQYQPYQAPAAPLSKQSTPWFRRTWVLIVGAALAGIILGSTTASASKTKTVAGPTVTTTATATVAGPTVRVTTTPVQVVATKTVAGPTVTYKPPVPAALSDGQYLVPAEIAPGLYKTPGGSNCYWERLKDLSGGLDSINDNDNITGPTTIQVFATDAAVKFNGGCEWTKVG